MLSPADAQPLTELPGSRGVLAKSKNSLNLKESSPRRLLAGSLGASLRLLAESLFGSLTPLSCR